MSRPLRHAGLFSGIGGFSYAAQLLGWENVFDVELDPWCRKVLHKNFPTTQLFDDVTTFSGLPFRGLVDVLSGGFPCQDASHARTHSSGGKHTGQGLSGKRTGLWWEYLRIIGEIQPAFVIGENVTAIRSKGLDTILQSLAEIGYDAEWCDMPAHWFGAPHSRERTWLVAYPHRVGWGEESLVLSQILSRPLRQAPQWEPSRAIRGPYRKKALSEAYGIHDGIPRKLGKRGLEPEIKAHGNAIVPWVALQIFQAIELTPSPTSPL